MTPIGWAMRPLQAAAPALAARLAERLFFTPPRSRPPAGHHAFLASGRRFELRAERRRVVGWRWGHGPPAHAVIAHSLGAAATALAVSWGLSVERLVFLAPPADPAAWVTPFARALAIRTDVIAQVRARSERRLGFHWADLDVPAIARRMTVPLLVAHDQDDQVVTWRDGAAIASAWPNARLVTTRGLGHRGVVHAPDVVREAVTFATDHGAALAACDESARLEHELFHRELRWARAAYALTD